VVNRMRKGKGSIETESVAVFGFVLLLFFLLNLLCLQLI
jgi:hypothetical protein